MKQLTKKSIKEVLEGVLNAKRDAWQIDTIYQTCKQKEYYLSGPRQIGKTTLAADTSLILAMKGLKVVYLCHRVDNVRDVMQRVLEYANPLKKEGIVTRISPSHGFYEIDFASGGKISFKVRTNSVSVGLTVDAIIWDEAQKIDSKIVEDVRPTLSQSDYKIQLFIGTPPKDDDWRLYYGGPFMEAKKRGLKNYKEFSAAEQYSPDIKINKATALKANPAGYRTKNFWADLERAAESMSHESFCRQYLGVWNVPQKNVQHEPQLTAKEVDKMLTTVGSKAKRFTASIGISANTNNAYIALNDGSTTEIAERFELEIGGLDDLIYWIKDRMSMFNVVRVPSTARGKALAAEFKAMNMGAKIKVVTLPEFSNNLARFLKQTEEESLKVYKADDVSLALSSFWLSFEPRSGSHDVKSGVPADVTLMMALVNSTVDGKILERNKGAKALLW